MGRRRRADRDEIIDAVGLVVRRNGLDALSIEAVAKAAGIGKASVLYDFKSKDALLAAFVERKIRLHREAVEELRAGNAGKPNATMHALLDYVQGPLVEDDLVSGMLVAAAASRNEHFRAFLDDMFTEEMDRVEAEARQPGAALIAYLALNGLLALEYFGFCEFEAARRRRALAAIAELTDFEGKAPAADDDTERNFPEFSRKSQVSP